MATWHLQRAMPAILGFSARHRDIIAGHE